MREMEEKIVKLFITRLLRHGCRIGIRDTFWMMMVSPPMLSLVYYVKLGPQKEDIKRANWSLDCQWAKPEDTAEDVLLTIGLQRRILNDITFYPGEDSTGVTWRMLKIDMPFLRMIFSTESIKTIRALRQITDRMVELLDQALEGDEDGERRNSGSGELIRSEDQHPDEGSGDDKNTPPPVQPEA